MADDSDVSEEILLRDDSENEDEESGPNSIDGVFVVSDGHISDDEGDSSDGDDSIHEQEENVDGGEQEQSGAAAAAERPKSPKLEQVEGGHWCYKCKKSIKGAVLKFKQHVVEKHGPQATQKVFCCGLCKRSYKTSRSLNRHLKEQHNHKYKPTPYAKKPVAIKKTLAKGEQPQTLEEINEVRRLAKSYLFSEAVDVDKEKRKKKNKSGAAASGSTEKPKPSLKRRATTDLTVKRTIKKEIKEEEPKLKQDTNKKQEKKRVNAKEKDTIEDDMSELVEAEEQAKIVMAQVEAEMNVRKEMVISREETNERAAMDTVIAQQKAKNEANDRAAIAQQKAKHEAAMDYAIAQQKAKNEAAMDYAIAQQKAKKKIRMQAALAAVEDRGKSKLGKAREDLDKIQQKLKQLTSRKRPVTVDLSSDDDDDDDQPRKKRSKEEQRRVMIDDDDDNDEEGERMDDVNLPLMDSNNTIPQRPIPEVIQIPGPHLNDIQAGNDPFASIPTNYSAADNVLKQKFAAAAATGRAAVGGAVGGAAGGTGASGGISSVSELERLERTSTNERDQVAYGEEVDRHERESNRTIASDHCRKTLIGFKNKEWQTWSDDFSFFGCIDVFQHNKFDSDNLVYVDRKKVKSTAKKLIKPAKRYLRSKGVHLRKNGKTDLHAISPHLSDFYNIIINVHSERKVNLTSDCRFLFDEWENWPVLDLLRSETGHFFVIKDYLAFCRVIRCDQCGRMFNNKSNLNRHLRGNGCPFVKFLEKCGIERTEEFFSTPPEEFMVKHFFPGGKVKPQLKIREKLETFGICLDVDFVFNHTML